MPGNLTFFCELPSDRLQQLFADGQVATLLARHACGVSMAMLDLTPDRAEVVRNLQGIGVPVTAWLLLEQSDGYWLTLDNVQLAQARWHAVRAWAEQHRLKFAAVGLDIEAPHDDAVALMESPMLTLARLAWLRRTRSEHREALAACERLVQTIRADVGLVETYQFPFIADERAAQSSLLQRVLGIADVRADREVLMLYRSALPNPWGAALVDTYGPGAEAIAVGITGGGVEALEASFAARELDLQTTLEELARAQQHTRQVYVFSLEGCVHKGWLADLLLAELPTPNLLLHKPSRAGRLLTRAVLRADKLVAWLRSARK